MKVKVNKQLRGHSGVTANISSQKDSWQSQDSRVKERMMTYADALPSISGWIERSAS
jgi:hypothetical protein